MKLNKIAILFLITGLIWSCDTKEEESIDETPLSEEMIEIETEKPVRTYSLEKQNEWVDYYSQNVKGFSLNNFVQDESFKIVRNESNITPIWSKDFKPVYKQFLAFNADSTKYVDIDSYKWGFDDKGELIVGPDQEIVLVDVANKKTERILFYGPSFWVEEAFFKNDSIVVLLENSTDNKPAYQEINLNQNKSDYYIYKDELEFQSEYLKNRVTDIYNSRM